MECLQSQTPFFVVFCSFSLSVSSGTPSFDDASQPPGPTPPMSNAKQELCWKNDGQHRPNKFGFDWGSAWRRGEGRRRRRRRLAESSRLVIRLRRNGALIQFPVLYSTLWTNTKDRVTSQKRRTSIKHVGCNMLRQLTRCTPPLIGFYSTVNLSLSFSPLLFSNCLFVLFGCNYYSAVLLASFHAFIISLFSFKLRTVSRLQNPLRMDGRSEPTVVTGALLLRRQFHRANFFWSIQLNIHILEINLDRHLRLIINQSLSQAGCNFLFFVPTAGMSK